MTAPDNLSTPAKIALEDGLVATGQAIGYLGETTGELCFNTSMTGYQEILTDPSYHGQIMMMTYPHIGNYGASDEDLEAVKPMVAGLVVRAFCHAYSNRLADESLHRFMSRHELVGITGVDTRMLVRHIRTKGVMNAVVSSVDLDEKQLVEKAKAVPSMEGLELASHVTVDAPYTFATGGKSRIAVYDYGVKLNILRWFRDLGCTVQVFPADTPLETVLGWQPDGLFFSNGPGDPRSMPGSIETAREAAERNLPMFGICLGHQLIALSQGLDVYKMYVGHRGANHPVKNLSTGRVEITTQNHGFAVDAKSVDGFVARMSHQNLNDQTVEGLTFLKIPAFSVQYHPEASPGPHDSRYLFKQFLQLIESNRTIASAPLPRADDA
jgi:carbamoyl-phosphate synthase small subunit